MADEPQRLQDAPDGEGPVWWDHTVPADDGQRPVRTARRRTALLVAAPAVALLALVGVVAAFAGQGGTAGRARVVVAPAPQDLALGSETASDDPGPELWYGPSDDGSGTATDGAAGPQPGTADGATAGATSPATTSGTTSATTTSGTTTSGTTTTAAPGTPTSPATTTGTSRPPTTTSTTTSRPPTTTTTTTAAAPDDPRYRTCKAANAHGYGPYRRGVDPEYAWYPDPDQDGVACD